MKNKKTYLNLIVLLIAILYTGCSKISSYQKSIYEDNIKIAAKADSYFFKSRIGKTDNNGLSIQFEEFTGKQKIWEIEVKEQTNLSINISTDIKSGKFKICIIDSENKVFIISQSKTNKEFSVDLSKGKQYIALVGYEAYGQLDIKLSDNENVIIHTFDK